MRELYDISCWSTWVPLVKKGGGCQDTQQTPNPTQKLTQKARRKVKVLPIGTQVAYFKFSHIYF